MRLVFAYVALFLAEVPLSTQTSLGQSIDGRPAWSIVIHGGAGGDTKNWKPEKKLARQKGMHRALSTGKAMLVDGESALDVVQAVIAILEDEAAFNAGRGAVLNHLGRAELDASIMNGIDLSCGAVAGVTTVKNPIALARQVMEKTSHVLIVSEGAESFAKKCKVEQVKPDYFLTYHDNADSLRENRILDQQPSEQHYGTVGCVVKDQNGDLAAGTSTGGTTKKLAGRVGDSPIVGAGTYADNRFAAVSGTGIGEEYIRHAAAYDVIAQMRYASRTLDQSVHEMIENRLPANSGGIIAVGQDGKIVLQHNTPSMTYGAASSDGRFDIGFGVHQTEEN